MSNQNDGPNGVQNNQANGYQWIEPDWTESEWFQVWLQLARHPYHFEEPDLTGKAKVVTLDLSTEASSVENLRAQG